MAPRKKKPDQKEGHVITLQGKEYITHIGLLHLAHLHGIQKFDGGFVFELCKPEADVFVYRAQIIDKDGAEWTAHGHASPANLNRKMIAYAAVMAETRAWNRAMRSMVNHGDTTADEMKAIGLGSQLIEESPVARREIRPSAQVPTLRQDSNTDQWWHVVQTEILECEGRPTPAEIDQICDIWSKGKATPSQLTPDRLRNLISKIATPDGQDLLHDIREREAIQKEGAQK